MRRLKRFSRMLAPKKPGPGQVILGVIECQNCGNLGVDIGNGEAAIRLSGHKCSGAWTTRSEHIVDVDRLQDAIKDVSC